MNNVVVARGQAAARDAGHRAEDAARESSGAITALGRLGYVACGVVYGLVGLLAAQAAMGAGGQTTDTRGALGWIVEAPFGRFVLGIIAIGLAGYALWRVLQAVLDTEHEGTEPKGWFARTGYAASGFVYAGLAITALGLATARTSDPGNETATTQDRTAWLMSQPFGPVLVAIAGAVVIGVAVAQFALAYRASFAKKMRTYEMSDSELRLAKGTGRLGYAARGVVFAFIGGFLLVAARRSDPGEAQGLGGVLATLAQQPFGPLLLGIVAVGLMAYGAFKFFEARYRRMVID